MIKYTLKHAIRSLLRQKQGTVINVLGLVVAVCTIFIISSWVAGELSYDKHHQKADRIYRLSIETGSNEAGNYWHFARTHQQWRREIPNFFPEIEEMVELAPTFNTVVEVNNHLFYERGFSVKPNLFEVFDFDFISGDPLTALENQHSIVISESLSEKYFRNTDPVGHTMKLKGGYIDEDALYTITGVYKDIPEASHFHTNFFVRYTEPTGLNKMEWAYTYFLLKEGVDIAEIREKLPGFIENHVPIGQQDRLVAINFTPLTDIHLKSNIEREIEPNGDIKQVRLFIFITIGVFIIALINFINLLTVSFGKRVLAFNINRIIGGKNRHVVTQLMAEAGMITFISILVSILLFKPFTMLLSSIGLLEQIVLTGASIRYLALISVFILLIVCLAGIIPYYLIKLKSVRRGGQVSSMTATIQKRSYYNKPLLVVQFAISILVIIGSLAIKKQNNFLFSQSLGQGNDNIVMLSRDFWSEEDQVMVLKGRLDNNPNIESYCATFDAPTNLNKDSRRVKSSKISGGYTDYSLSIFVTDHSLFEFFNLPLVAGRTMKPYIEGQKFEEYVVNESAVKKMGFNSPEDVIGMDFSVQPYFAGIIHGGQIVGVVKDFKYSSLYHPIQPTVFFQKPIWQWYVLVKLEEGDRMARINSLKDVWQDIYPNYPFEYELLSDIYTQAYQKDIRFNKLINLFSILCIIISSIGLLGITSVVLISKTKEIGVRKVNGATIWELIYMLIRDMVGWVLVAFLIACPVAWYYLNKWLENYAYKTNLDWWLFAVGGVVALTIAIITVASRIWKAASRNPVEALRYE